MVNGVKSTIFLRPNIVGVHSDDHHADRTGEIFIIRTANKYVEDVKKVEYFDPFHLIVFPIPTYLAEFLANVKFSCCLKICTVLPLVIAVVIMLTLQTSSNKEVIMLTK